MKMKLSGAFAFLFVKFLLAGKFKDKFVEGRDIWSFTINFEEIFYFGNNFRVYAAFDVSQTPIYYTVYFRL